QAVAFEARQVEVNRRSGPETECLERRRGVNQVRVEVAAALSHEQATRREEGCDKLDHYRQRAQRAGRRPIVGVAVTLLARGDLGAFWDNLDIGQSELRDGFAQKI